VTATPPRVNSTAMRRSLLIGAVGVAILAAAPLAAAIQLPGTTPATVHVTPSAGGPRTTFRISVRNLAQTGMIGTMQRFDALTVSGPHRAGCVGSGGMTLPSAAANQVIRVALSPARIGTGPNGRWCTGTFLGRVVQTTRFTCGPPEQIVCPMLEVRPQPIATFSFRVARRS
jgi:hypothetical protein